jgi:hypothetical protein
VEKKRTAVYALPKFRKSCPAERILQYKRLITGPLICSHKKIIALSGYNVPIYLSLYDYNNSNFFSGNKRKIKIALPFHQVEGRYQDGLHYYLTNENFVRKPILIARNNCTALI